jgi:hypothetical protein
MRQFENLKIGWRPKMDFEFAQKFIGIILTATFYILNSFFE